MVEREPMRIDQGVKSFSFFLMEGTTGLTCQRTTTIHVRFDTSFEHLWVRERSVASCISWKDVSCEVTDVTSERRN